MANTTDLTHGSIRGQFLALAIPLLMGNILQQLYNTVDAVIVGKFVGDAAFAAVGVAGAVMNLFLFLINGGCIGISTMLSQLHGKGDEGGFRQDFFLSAVFGGLVTLLLTAGGLLVLRPLLGLMKTPQEVLPHAAAYLQVIFLGLLASFAFHLCSAVLRSVGNTRAALLFLTVSMGVNLVLDVVFIARLNWGVAGAAWATVIAQGLAAVLCVCYLWRDFPQLVFRRENMRYNGPLLRRTGQMAFGTALQMCSLYIGKLLVQGTVNSLGTASISAYTAATRLEGFANSFGDSGASAMSVFIAQNTGAGNDRRVRQGFREGERMLAGFGLFMSGVMIAGASVLLPLVLPEGDGASLAPAVGYLRLVGCFYLFNFLGSGLSGYFRGRGRVHIAVMGTTGHITMRAVLSWLLAGKMQLPAVALATGLGWMWVNLFWLLVQRREWKGMPSAGAGE